jgi:hypothetical protein
MVDKKGLSGLNKYKPKTQVSGNCYRVNPAMLRAARIAVTTTTLLSAKTGGDSVKSLKILLQNDGPFLIIHTLILLLLPRSPNDAP